MSLYGLTLRFLDFTKSVLPANWRLAIRYYGLLSSKTVEPELANLFLFCRQFRTAIDIGANHGYYTYKMAKKFEQVFVFEPNREEDFDIKHFKKKNVHFFPYGLSDVHKKTDLHIPVKQGMAYSGWASVGARVLPFADATIKTTIELQRLDDQPFVQNHTIDLIKIDVEGHELEVLLGGLETIRLNKPVLIIENNEAQTQEIKTLLEGLGYQQHNYSSLTRKQIPSPNLIYIPA